MPAPPRKSYRVPRISELQVGPLSHFPYVALCHHGSRRGYFEGKISWWAGFEAEADAETLRAASRARVTGGKQISVLQA